jgi:hypothetical protein
VDQNIGGYAVTLKTHPLCVKKVDTAGGKIFITTFLSAFIQLQKLLQIKFWQLQLLK